MEAAFLKMILGYPERDDLRLIYADWLEEQGNSDRAEFIRLQCGEGNPEREQELLDKHWQEWGKPLLDILHKAKKSDIVYERGFPAIVTLRYLKDIVNKYQLLTIAPIKGFHLSTR